MMISTKYRNNMKENIKKKCALFSYVIMYLMQFIPTALLVLLRKEKLKILDVDSLRLNGVASRKISTKN